MGGKLRYCFLTSTPQKKLVGMLKTKLPAALEKEHNT
jgi:hypothetical protein